MKPLENLVSDHIKNLKPCVHGGEVLDAAGKSGLKREEILDFSSSVNPLGPSKKALEAAKKAFSEIPAYPDSNSTVLRQAIASHFSGIGKNNVVVGNGSTELMYLFAEAFLKKGEVALIPAPTFGEYESAVRKQVKRRNSSSLTETSTLAQKFSSAKWLAPKSFSYATPTTPQAFLSRTKPLQPLLSVQWLRTRLFFSTKTF